MLKRIDLTDLFKAIQGQVEKNTKLPCYDAIPENAQSPFYFMELSGHKPSDTKTMYVERYSVSFHVIAEPTPSSVPTYKYIKMLEEALTDDIKVPRPYRLVEQIETGVNTIYMEQTGEKHTVVGFDFLISYGYKVKI